VTPRAVLVTRVLGGARRGASQAWSRIARLALVLGVAVGLAAVGTGAYLASQPARLDIADAGVAPLPPQPVAGGNPPPPTVAPPAALAPGRAPVELRLPAPGDGAVAPRPAAVVPVGVEPSGALQVPADGAVVGWWSSGAAPGGAQGAVVLAGHVDTAAGAGAMRQVLDLPLGSVVEVADEAGGVLAYRVTGREQFDKAALPRGLFRADGPPGLVLITCGGTFDARTGHYSDNVVVYAEPV